VTIKIKIARTAKEIDDVFRLRYDVYVREEGKFGGQPNPEGRIVDHFDAMPGVANVIAYCNDEAIGSIRINANTNIGLPVDEYCNIDAYKAKVLSENNQAVFGSSGMLAVKRAWRNKRKVFYALLKTAIGAGLNWNASHVIVTVKKETLSLYGRIGFEIIGDNQWIDDVQDEVIPMAAPYPLVYDWAFGDISSKLKPFWLENMGRVSERLLLEPSEVLFREKDDAHEAYAVDHGWVSISKKDEQNHELVLANLSEGELFGELAVLQGGGRSATATALTNLELVVIEREQLLAQVKANPDQLLELLQYFAKRVRETDDFLMVNSFAPQTGRVRYALKSLWGSAKVDNKMPHARLAKVGPENIAKKAQTRIDEVLVVLEMEKMAGRIEYGTQFIRFLSEPKVDASDK